MFIYPIQLLASEDEHDHEHHKAHVHGEAKLFLVAEGNALEIEFTSPAMNIVGFEHQPENHTQSQAVESAIEALKQTGQLFSLPSDAKCETLSVNVESPFSGHEEHAHGEETHSDFAAHYHFQCANMSQLKRIEINIFKQFPATDVIEVQSISRQGQQKRDLTPEHNSVEL
ncbi:hypothetical protein BOW39_10255 [Solemya velum gill symbiont]|nr:hypothetical protein BOW38_09295 [Solemya velum gill symbiont]OOZ48564.1 hypothetical protein BOW39_10255 [Solemya velum gill symbiont]OOZ50747.1 hypothetical protein BOW40_09470 [Solemya velum gill symbiont]OOZ53650.1 hypothetical protein BOW41_09340 [Solemya velum gill symbiont]OOZ55886.1 hypothetical protein BOW42_09000 [Solemya velum gill symbiont]